jgi:hypothetical protein
VPAASATCRTARGRPSNGPAAGLPESYFIQQLHDFKNGLRTHAEPRKANVNQMIAIAKAMTPEGDGSRGEVFRLDEVDARGSAWSSRARCPKTRAQGNIFYTLPGKETETDRRAGPRGA